MPRAQECLNLYIMSLQVGDKVSFLNEPGSGIILKLTAKGKAVVETDLGLEIEYPLKYLVPLAGAEDYALHHADEIRFIKAKIAGEKKAKKSKNTPAPKEKILEIDLHIYELVDNHKNLSNGEMLRIQIRTLKRKLAEAFRKDADKLIVIHGVGEGVLKMEVRNELRHYENIEYSDADYRQYGYGATEIRFRKQKRN